MLGVFHWANVPFQNGRKRSKWTLGMWFHIKLREIRKGIKMAWDNRSKKQGCLYLVQQVEEWKERIIEKCRDRYFSMLHWLYPCQTITQTNWFFYGVTASTHTCQCANENLKLFNKFKLMHFHFSSICYMIQRSVLYHHVTYRYSPPFSPSYSETKSCNFNVHALS